jgi:chromate transporter
VKIRCLAFGGGNAAIPLLEAAAVPRWVSQQEFGERVGLNFAFLGLSILKLAGMVGLRAVGIPGLLVAVIGLTAGN